MARHSEEFQDGYEMDRRQTIGRLPTGFDSTVSTTTASVASVTDSKPTLNGSDETYPSALHRQLDKWDYLTRHRNPEYYAEDKVLADDLESCPPLDKISLAPPQAPVSDPNIVDWDGPDDPSNPFNWPKSKKWSVTVVVALMTFCTTFSSSVFSTATYATAELYGVSVEVMVLGTSLFVLVIEQWQGFAVGPIIWGPLSELYGRMIPLFGGFAGFIIFQIPVAVAQNVHTIMLCRFFGGVFGSAPVSIAGGLLADFWNPVDRGAAVCIFAATTFLGPVAGPIIGGFITPSYLGWRWTAYITAIMGLVFMSVAVLLAPESYAPVILQRKAKRIRYATKNWAVRARADEDLIDARAIITRYLFRPFHMLVLEPILILLTLYMSLVYGILYLFFVAYPLSYQAERHWSQGVGALPFLSISVGILLGLVVIVIVAKTRFARKMAEHGRIVPEERLTPMMLGAFCLPIGLFWFAWTSDPRITWVPQVLSGIPFGAGVQLIFLPSINYLIDVYTVHANSALAANTFVRSIFGAVFPLFATAMYKRLGVAWATSLLGFLTVGMIPVPLLFYLYGSRVRAWSKFAK
ncbi:MAG: hypothetical protein M1817_001218 [Caeruleum heppii]|nr:MAG: hypothetical protein M1817_001218 [Caeruleum heppii]